MSDHHPTIVLPENHPTTKLRPTDNTGKPHGFGCWAHAEQSLRENAERDGAELMRDGTIPKWNTTADVVISEWFADGTVTCYCDDE
jgi:hemolysin-activating ACP:hemolysin acyltransferase